jgi:cytochrome c-type biogenesis protein
VLLGATATALSNLLAQHMELLGKIAGVIIILFGLHFTGLIRLGMLNLEKRVHPQRRPSGIAGSYLLGMAFAFGWTPCVGPILATILMVAAGGDSPWYGPSLLGVYAAGLGLPFLIAALAVGPFMTFAGRWRKHMHLVELLTGGLLIITGIAIFTGSLADVALWMLETFPIFSGVG